VIRRSWIVGFSGFALGVSCNASHGAFSWDAGGGVFTLTGYIREYLSLNLENKPDVLANGHKLEGKGRFNMARSVLLLDGRAEFGKVSFTSIGRWSREVETSYLDRLNDSSGGDIMDEYNENALREAYMDLKLTDQLSLRLGKQQVAWGEADSFQVLDVVNGFDFNWRSSFEAENEELRKPLYMANIGLEVPALNGALQVLLRPGWDDKEDAVHTLPLKGGRFAPQGSRGTDITAVIPQNFDHSSGDTKDPSYGARWSGTLGDYGYSLNYYRTVSAAPVINFADFGLPGFRPYGDAPSNGFAELIYPRVDILGGSITTYASLIDSVIRAEAAYIPNKPYNHGMSGTPLGGALGIMEKDTLSWMVGVDKLLRGSMRWFKTSEPAFLTGQIFDTWVTNFNESDDLLDLGVTPRKEHSVITSLILNLNYRFSTFNPVAGLIVDPTYGGGVVLLGLTNIIGDHFRIYSEYLGFFKSGQTCSVDPASGRGIECQHGFGNFDNADQFTVRITYQF
jgi:hypothetical protein